MLRKTFYSIRNPLRVWLLVVKLLKSDRCKMGSIKLIPLTNPENSHDQFPC